MVCQSACGRSVLLEPSPQLPEPGTPAPQDPPLEKPAAPSPLLGHWAEFHLGNGINDEAWLSFGERSQMTVISVDRNFCGPHSLAATRGTDVEGPETLKLAWAPPSGPHELETSYAVLRRSQPVDWHPEGYRLGDRAISMRAWRGSAGPFTRVWIERSVESGKTYARATRAEVVMTAEQLVRRLLWLIPPRGLHLTNFLGLRLSRQGAEQRAAACACACGIGERRRQEGAGVRRRRAGVHGSPAAPRKAAEGGLGFAAAAHLRVRCLAPLMGR